MGAAERRAADVTREAFTPATTEGVEGGHGVLAIRHQDAPPLDSRYFSTSTEAFNHRCLFFGRRHHLVLLHVHCPP